jgi:hypothetical protein
MAKLQTFVRIPKTEYIQFKKFKKHFEEFLKYVHHAHDIRAARKDIQTKRILPQENLFRELGL